MRIWRSRAASPTRRAGVSGAIGKRGTGYALLYGLPGQERFRFMFDVVRAGLVGVVILVDASSPGGLDGFVRTLALYAHELRGMPCVVAINKSTQMDNALPAACQRNLREYGVLAPVIQVDARQRPDVSRIAQLLFTMLRYNTRVLAPVAAAR